MKNSKYLKEEKGVSAPPNKKKTKDWIVEYKWKSLEDYNKYPKSFYKSECYSDQWRPLMFSNKYHSLKAAIQSIDNFIKIAVSYHSSSIMKGFYDDRFGKHYRIRNLKTNETHLYNN